MSINSEAREEAVRNNWDFSAWDRILKDDAPAETDLPNPDLTSYAQVDADNAPPQPAPTDWYSSMRRYAAAGNGTGVFIGGDVGPQPDKTYVNRSPVDPSAAEKARLSAQKAELALAKLARRTLSRQVAAEQAKIDDTFRTILRQTQWASLMLWITFLLGAFLVIASVCAFFFHPEAKNPLVAAFFGAGALSMLGFFLRDPADKVQRAGAKLVQLQVAMRYNLDEARYWQWYFGAKGLNGHEASGPELLGALNNMRDSTQTIMRQIDESLGSRSADDGG